MAVVKVEVTQIGVKFDPPIPEVYRLDPIDWEFTFWSNSQIARVELSEFYAFKNSGPSFSPNSNVTNNWHSYRGQSFSVTPASPNDTMPARTNIGGQGGYFIKYKLTMTHKNGTRLNVDPILDERPGGSGRLSP